MKPRTDKYLQKAFGIFNEKYFNSAIKIGTEVRYANEKDCKGADGLSCEHFIFIHNDYRKHPDMGLIVLLHEMRHCYLAQNGYVDWKRSGGHHMLFYAGLDKLYQMGAYEGLL